MLRHLHSAAQTAQAAQTGQPGVYALNRPSIIKFAPVT